MADPSETTTEPGRKLQFQLNIISPSPEVSRLNFPNISPSCTVAQLKQRISDASESRIPLPSQQRLIYRGQVLAQEQRTLGDVFGREIIDNSNEPLTLHLAINPGMTHQQLANSFQPPQARAQQTPILQPTGANSVASPQFQSPGAMPQTTSEVPLQPQVYPGQNIEAQVPQNNPFPHLHQTFALMNQQFVAQMAALGNNPTVQNAAPNNPQYQPHHPHVHHHHPHGPVHQVHLPQGLPMQGNPNMTPQQALQHYMAQQAQFRQQNQYRSVAADQQGINMGIQRSNSAPPPGLGNTNTVIRETYGPNGERHQSIFASGTIQINPNAPITNPGLRRRESPRAGPSRSRIPNSNLQPPNQDERPGIMPLTPLSGMQLQALQAHMSSMESAMNLGSIPPDSIQEQTRTLLQSVSRTISPQQFQILESRRQALSTRAVAMRRNLDAQMHRAAEQEISQRGDQATEHSTIYVIASSSGPQALLISPSGYYAAGWPMISAPAVQSASLPEPPILNAAQDAIAHAQQAQANALQAIQGQPNGHQEMNLPNILPPAEHQQQQAQAPNPARDIVRILIPLGGHLWLLIRLLGFVYFFTNGGSWYRTIFLSLAAFLLFIAQTAIFQPLLQIVWGPIRRHAEALLPLAGHDQRQRDDDAGAPNANGSVPQERNGDPTPQEAAERLLREREALAGSFVRQGLRRIERAVALFIASLVPGVGERHIAAREAAEAARQQEERERDERTRREEEERQQAQRNAEDGRGDGDPAAGNTGQPAGGPPSTQEQSAQPQLIDA